MKKIIYILVVSAIFDGSMNAHHFQTTENMEIYAPDLNVHDSLFLECIDSLIFNSVCPTLKETRHKIFSVDCQSVDKQKSIYQLTISLEETIHIYPSKEFRGYFEYKDYLFLWYYDIPENILSISGKKIRTYMNEIYDPSALRSFIFSYSPEKLELTGICCY